MASVSSLDQDMRKLRLDRYTPGAANEVRKWIEDILGEPLPPGDLMQVLRDGVALCKLVNQAVSPGVRYKASSMPFVQMENISHFLRACEMPPLSLPSHDRFLTVDLYDNKDPAQVLQCIAAFSRRANLVNPSAFPSAIGAKSKGKSLSPDSTGPGQSPYTPKVVGYTTNSPKTDTSPVTTFNSLNKAAYSNQGRTSPTKSNSLSRGGLATGSPVSSWSSRADEGKTAPAWNIHQYGYMGGASQGNQGVAFGARRQITSASPDVPSLAQKEKAMREKAMREKLEREKRELEENEQRLQAQQDADDARAREEEERSWQEETRRLKDDEDRARAQEEASTQRAEQARRDQQAQDRIASSRSRQRTTSDARLNGQFLSAYNATQKPTPLPPARKLESQQSAEAQRIAELERQLAEMKQAAAERERHEQEQEQEQGQGQGQAPTPSYSTHSTPSKPALPTRPSGSVQTARQEDDGQVSERDYLKKAHQEYHQTAQPKDQAPTTSSRPESSRPLPDPTTYQSSTNPTSNTNSTRPTRASKSLIEREMERERERQREWEESQRATASAARDMAQGSGPGQTWDVHQYGFTGGDSQNRGGAGLGVGGARRQIIGPRPPR